MAPITAHTESVFIKVHVHVYYSICEGRAERDCQLVDSWKQNLIITTVRRKQLHQPIKKTNARYTVSGQVRKNSFFFNFF